MFTTEKAHKVVFGLFDNKASLEAGIDALKASQFRNQDISVLMPSSFHGSETLGHEKATKAPEGATTGAVSGFAIGTTLGWLVGIGSLAIPGIGPFVAAGPIMAAIAGAGIGSAVGGVAGGLIGLGIPEYEAKRYESEIKNGGILLSVHVDDGDWQAKAKHILEEAGARDISTAGEVEGGMRTSAQQTTLPPRTML